MFEHRLGEIELSLRLQTEAVNAIAARLVPGGMQRFLRRDAVVGALLVLLASGLLASGREILILRDRERDVATLRQNMPRISENLEIIASAVDNLCNLLVRSRPHESGDPRCSRLPVAPLLEAQSDP